MFIQVIQGHCRDVDEARRLGDEWLEKLSPGADGWLGTTFGTTDDDQLLGVVRFDSHEAAERNSARPEQGEWWQRFSACFDGDITFHDCDDVTMFLGGGSDDAGFVQIIQGKLKDPERFRKWMSQPMDALADARPDILGGTVAIDADGNFTETIAFRTEEEARKGEQMEMPADRQKEFQDEMAQVEGLSYYDLHHPWFTSAKAG